MPVDAIRTVEVKKSFDGDYDVDFPDAAPVRTVEKKRILTILESAERALVALTPLKTEEDLKGLLESSVRSAIEALPPGELGREELASVLATLDGVRTEAAPKTSAAVPRYK